MFEDEKCYIPVGMEEKFEKLPEDKARFVEADNLSGLVTLKKLSNGLMKQARDLKSSPLLAFQ